MSSTDGLGPMDESKELTEREIDAIVIAQVDDPEAWEQAIRVRPRRAHIDPSRPPESP
jgi:hypothetical protein